MGTHIINIHGIVDSETEKRIRELMSGKSVISSIEIPQKHITTDFMKTFDLEEILKEWEYCLAIGEITRLTIEDGLPFHVGMALHNYVTDNYTKINS